MPSQDSSPCATRAEESPPQQAAELPCRYLYVRRTLFRAWRWSGFSEREIRDMSNVTLITAARIYQEPCNGKTIVRKPIASQVAKINGLSAVVSKSIITEAFKKRNVSECISQKMNRPQNNG
jgi:hypothetical protein